ncbi:MAG: hypothetical protein MRY78_14620 [Saprospiraceae bacterium]|nr:hypothetical protein [Saprospiraceae bacterium]
MAQTPWHRWFPFLFDQGTHLDRCIYGCSLSMYLIFWLCLSANSTQAWAQATPVFLKNASFEDTPLQAKPPVDWFYCGSSAETPPDVHPNGMFGVRQTAYHGRTYVGLVTRHNATTEAIGQRLESPLQAEVRYHFCLMACQSDQYRSVHRITREPFNYVEPVRIRIWGSNRSCEPQVLLAQSELITHTAWKKYCFEWISNKRVDFLRIEAFHESEEKITAGNVLIDQASPLIPEGFEIPKVELDQKTSLANIIRQYGPSVTFRNSSHVALSPELFQDSSAHIHQANLPFWLICQYWTTNPDISLQIGIRASTRKLYKQRKKHLQNLLYDYHIPKQQWRIKRVKKQSKQWLYQQNSDLYFSIQS